MGDKREFGPVYGAVVDDAGTVRHVWAGGPAFRHPLRCRVDEVDCRGYWYAVVKSPVSPGHAAAVAAATRRAWLRGRG